MLAMYFMFGNRQKENVDFNFVYVLRGIAKHLTILNE